MRFLFVLLLAIDNVAGALGAGLLQLMSHDGKASQLASTNVVCEPTGWNVLAVDVRADRIQARLNQQLVLQAVLPCSARAGRVGLITHAETVAAFDDFSFN